MEKNEDLEKAIRILEELAKQGIYLDLKICPRCKAVGLKVMDVVGMYSPLAPVRLVCKKCGWVGRAAIEITNRKIDELDEEMLDDIIKIISEEEKEEDKDIGE